MTYKDLIYLHKNIPMKNYLEYLWKNSIYHTTKIIYVLPKKGWTYTITGDFKI